jgi:hypothetical protein
MLATNSVEAYYKLVNLVVVTQVLEVKTDCLDKTAIEIFAAIPKIAVLSVIVKTEALVMVQLISMY